MHTLETHLAEMWPAHSWRDLGVLVALSGGADSTALLCSLAVLKRQSGGRGFLMAGHVNHRLRGRHADTDEQAAVEICQSHGLECVVTRLEPQQLHDTEGEGFEGAARQARYRALQGIAEQHGARYVVTAHTANDQAETVLHRVIRGTGLAGLAGIPRVRPLGPAVTVVRPLLSAWRSDIETYLSATGQTYQLDATNQDRQFTRNRIRHELLPFLEKHFNSNAGDALVRLASMAGEAQGIIDGLVDALWDQAVESCTTTEFVVSATTLAGQPRYLVREVLKRAWREASWPEQAMGFAQWDKLADLVSENLAAQPQVMMPGEIIVSRSEIDETVRFRRG